MRDQLWTLWARSRRSEQEERDASASASAAEGVVLESGPEDAVLRARDRLGGGKPGKRQIVQALLASWGWPRVEQVERERQVARWRNTITEKGALPSHDYLVDH